MYLLTQPHSIKLNENLAARRRIFFKAVNDGIDLTGLDPADFDVYVLQGGATTMTVALGTGFLSEVDFTDMPGLYCYEAKQSEVSISGPVVFRFWHASMQTVEVVVEVVASDPHDGVRAGLTALPNAAAAAAGGLFTRGTGAGQINQSVNGTIDVNLTRWITGTPNALVSGKVDANVTDVATSTDVSAIKAKTDLLPSTAAGSVGGLIVAGGASGTLNLTATNEADANVAKWRAGTPAVLRSSGFVQTDVGSWRNVQVADPTTGGYPRIDVELWRQDTPAFLYTTGGGVKLIRSFPFDINPPVTSAIATAAATAVWGALTSAHNVVGSFGEFIKTLPTASTVAETVWDTAVEGTKTARQFMRGIRSVLWGKRVDTASSRAFRDAADTKDRIVATVDTSGRSSVTEDLD